MKSTIINIPEPCNQPWASMTPNENGRFCHSCQKNLTDLNNKSDKELVHFFRDNQENLPCIRIPKSKLNVPLYAFENETHFINLKAIVLGTAILTSFVGFSNEEKQTLPENYLVELVQNDHSLTSEKTQEIWTLPEENIIEETEADFILGQPAPPPELYILTNKQLRHKKKEEKRKKKEEKKSKKRLEKANKKVQKH